MSAQGGKRTIHRGSSGFNLVWAGRHRGAGIRTMQPRLKTLQRASLLSVLLSISACVRQPDYTFYVVVPEPMVSHFPTDLSKIYSATGLEPYVSSLQAGGGLETFAILAEGRGLSIQTLNVPMSGQEDPSACGAYVEPHPDPGQFLVSITRTHFGRQSSVDDIVQRLKSEMSKSSYEVRSQPILCSPSARSASSDPSKFGKADAGVVQRIYPTDHSR
jgi:hypothetical protein